MAKPDDSSLNPDQLSAVEKRARQLLDRASVWERFPTPIGDILAAAELRGAPPFPIKPERVRHPDLCRLPAWVRNEMKAVETEIKFAGYLEQQRRSMERLKRDEARAIPAWFDYAACSGLSREMVETLGRVRPRTLGQASRIQGVTPAAVSLVNCYIEIQAKRQTA